MALQDTMDPSRKSEGKDRFKENNEKLKKRFEIVKERHSRRDHPAFDEDNKQHCAYDNYGIGCYDFTKNLPKGVPRQTFMDTLFHELENTPPVEEIEDLIYEMENYVGAQALAAKEKIVEKLKQCAKDAGNKVKELVKGPNQAKEANEAFSWAEEFFDLFMKLFTGEISLTTIVRVLVNVLKMSLKCMWKFIQRAYEPYLNTIMLIIWWVNVIIQFLALVSKRLVKVVELLQRAVSFQIRIPEDTEARCYMHGPAQAEPKLIVRNILLEEDSQTALQQANYAAGVVNQEVSNLTELQAAIKAEVANAKSQQSLKNTEAEMAKRVNFAVNAAIGNVMNALGVQDALTGLLGNVGSMSEALSKLAKISATAANIDKMIDKFCDAVFGVLDKILEAIGEAADAVGLGWLI